MSKDYREIYEKELGVKLQSSVASIHHLDFNHANHNLKNLVALPQELHDSLNITFSKIRKTSQLIIKAKCYWLIKSKTLREMENHIHNYMELKKYIDLKNVIQKQGLSRAIEIFGRDFVERIIVIVKEKQ